MCTVCEKLFSTQSSHNRHFREVHHLEPKPITYGKESPIRWTYRCAEQQCDNAFPTNKRLMDHLEVVHQIKFPSQSLVMESMNGKFCKLSMGTNSLVPIDTIHIHICI